MPLHPLPNMRQSRHRAPHRHLPRPLRRLQPRFLQRSGLELLNRPAAIEDHWLPWRFSCCHLGTQGLRCWLVSGEIRVNDNTVALGAFEGNEAAVDFEGDDGGRAGKRVAVTSPWGLLAGKSELRERHTAPS